MKEHNNSPYKATVLIVDDNSENRLLLSSQLSIEGYQILQANGGIQGIDMAREHNPDIILLDVMMPDMNGFDVCKALRKDLTSPTQFIPIIMVTALRQTQYRIQGFEAGADEFLSRPHVREELLVKIRSLIQLKQARVKADQERQELLHLYNFNLVLSSTQNIDDMLFGVLNQLLTDFKTVFCAIVLVDEAENATTAYILQGENKIKSDDIFNSGTSAENAIDWIIKNRQSLVSNTAHKQTDWSFLKQVTNNFEMAIGLPLHNDRYVIGVILLTFLKSKPFITNQLVLLEMISAEITTGIENTILLEKMNGAIEAFIEIDTFEEMLTAHKYLDWTAHLSAPLLRSKVIETFKALLDISQSISAYPKTTNSSQKLALLLRTTAYLNELYSHIQDGSSSIERTLLKRILLSWGEMLENERIKISEETLKHLPPVTRRFLQPRKHRSTIWKAQSYPIDNPYVAGDPVYPPLLAGRTDIFNRIAEVWSAKANPDSIILYGHRRMGKSSILRNLDQAAPNDAIMVYADMAGDTSFVASTGDLLLQLADRLHQALQTEFPNANLPEPDPGHYATDSQAQIHFNRLTERVAGLLNGRSLIIALDEFEALEKAVEAGKIGVEIFQFLRTKTQEPWLTLVFGGLHTLDEMSRDYQQPFYGSYTNIRVSYLAHADAWHLITNPTPDFTLNYDSDAVERIIAETGGQPYLIQQLCRDALDHLNHELFDLQRERPQRILLTDVEAAMADNFFHRGMVYFDGVWAQAASEAQRQMLRVIAQRERPWTLAELAEAAGQPPDELAEHLRWGERHDILQKVNGDTPTWRFYVPLMRRWIVLRHS